MGQVAVIKNNIIVNIAVDGTDEWRAAVMSHGYRLLDLDEDSELTIGDAVEEE